MKKAILLFLAVVLFSSCGFNKIDGNGKIVTKKIETIKNISKLEVSGAFNVKVKRSEKTYLKITTDSNLLEYIGLKISGEKLEIYSKESMDPTDGILIELGLPRLSYIDLSGANELKAYNLMGKELKIECSGASTLFLQGKVQKLDAEISGSADMNSSGLIAEDVRIEISGAGNATVYASKALRVSASGAAEISYLGNPELVNVDVSGAATVNKIQNK